MKYSTQLKTHGSGRFKPVSRPDRSNQFIKPPKPQIDKIPNSKLNKLRPFGKTSSSQLHRIVSATPAANPAATPSLRRLTLEKNGNLRLYRWDNDVNGSRQWVPEWAAVSNPCDIAGVCGNGICDLDGSKTNASCKCLPGTSRVGSDEVCWGNLSLAGSCFGPRRNSTSQFKITTMAQTNYYFSESSVIANYSDIPMISKCGDVCLSDCECVASVYGLNEETAYCWVLKSLEFGGFQDPGATMFLKVGANVSETPGDGDRRSGDSSEYDKTLVLPIVLCMSVLIGLLCLMLYYSLHGRRSLRKACESSLQVSGAPLNFSYRDLQSATNNFSQLLGTGGFGSVYKGNLGDGTLIAVKKLERVLPHGEKEFITEVNTIGSMHHMNLVRLCGFCSEGSNRLLVYEFLKNGEVGVGDGVAAGFGDGVAETIR